MNTKLCDDLILSTPLYNSSCPIAITHKQLDEIDRSWSGAILTKSCTLKPNELKTNKIINQRYEYDLFKNNSYNRNGLLNPGIKYYLDYKKKSNKPYIISVALNKSNTYEELVKYFSHNKENFPNSLELNISCPNHSDSYNSIENFVNVFKSIESNNKPMPILGLKLMPNIDIHYIDKISDILKESSKIKYIVCSNTIPRGISSNGYIGAIGGEALKPISLWNVYEYNRRLNNNINIVGCGGVFNYYDFDHYLKCGAIAVQIGTGIYEHGITTIQKILKEYNRQKFKSKL